MKLNNEEYKALVAAHAQKSPMGKDCLLAFLVGGGICVLGQLLLDLYTGLGLTKDAAGTAVSVTLIGLSALLTALGVYDKLAKHAGAGTLVPITGFANAVSSAAIEFRSEGLVTGLAANLFRIAGPVIVYGAAASVVYGLLLCLLG